MLIVTAPELAQIHDLQRQCEQFPDSFDEARWEEGLRQILGSSVVDEMKKHQGKRTFPVQVGEWISRWDD